MKSITKELPSKVVSVLKNTYMLILLGLVVTALSTAVTLSLGITVSFWVLMGLLVLKLGSIFAVHWLRDSVFAVPLFLVFTALCGVSLTPVVAIASSSVLVLAFVLTSFIFITLSAYTIITKKDFEGLGNYLVGALILLVVAYIVSATMGISLASTGLSYISVLIFSGFMLYDTSEITNGRETNYVLAAVGLYLNFLNLFQSLVSILED